MHIPDREKERAVIENGMDGKWTNCSDISLMLVKALWVTEALGNSLFLSALIWKLVEPNDRQNTQVTFDKMSKASREPVVYSVGMYKLCSSQPAQKIILIKKLCNGDALNCTTFGSGH